MIQFNYKRQYMKSGEKMNFKEEMEFFENYESKYDYISKIGDVPVLFTAAHTMIQHFDDGTIKLAEPYTKAIAMYVNKHCNTSYLIKIKDTGIDSNRDNHDDFKTELIKIVRENNIKLVIDLHGARKERDFDVEFGTLNNLTADFSTIKEFEEAFLENGIKNIKHNEPFKGGAITQYLYNIKDVDVIQLETNGNLRDLENIERLNQLCDAIVSFINQYIDYTNR